MKKHARWLAAAVALWVSIYAFAMLEPKFLFQFTQRLLLSYTWEKRSGLVVNLGLLCRATHQPNGGRGRAIITDNMPCDLATQYADEHQNENWRVVERNTVTVRIDDTEPPIYRTYTTLELGRKLNLGDKVAVLVNPNNREQVERDVSSDDISTLQISAPLIFAIFAPWLILWIVFRIVRRS